MQLVKYSAVFWDSAVHSALCTAASAAVQAELETGHKRMVYGILKTLKELKALKSLPKY